MNKIKIITSKKIYSFQALQIIILITKINRSKMIKI